MSELNIGKEQVDALGMELVFEMNFTDLGATAAQVAAILTGFEAKSKIDIPTAHESKITSIEGFLLAAMQVSVATSINGYGLGLDGIDEDFGTGPSDFGIMDTFKQLGLSETDIYNASKAATDPFSRQLCSRSKKWINWPSSDT